MKKLFSVLAVLFVLGTVNVFALGIGPQGGYDVGGSPTADLTFKLDSTPFVFAAGAKIGKHTSIGITADYWLANPKIEGTWGYYYGVGAAANMQVNGEFDRFFVGGRALVGTNVFVLDKFIELYLQLAWQPGIAITEEIGYDHSFPVNIGLRFWF